MLAGVQEACSSWTLLPQETIRECNVPYAAVAGKRIRRRLERESLVRWGRDWSDPQVRWLRTGGRRLTSREARGSKRWVHAEVLRNDSAYARGPKNRRCTRIAYGICRPGSLAGRFPEPVPNVLDGFMAHLEADGMPRTAAAVERERERCSNERPGGATHSKRSGSTCRARGREKTGAGATNKAGGRNRK